MVVDILGGDWLLFILYFCCLVNCKLIVLVKVIVWKLVCCINCVFFVFENLFFFLFEVIYV